MGTVCVNACVCHPLPPTRCLFAAGPGATAGRGSAVGYQWGYFHNGCLKRGGAGEGSGEGEGAEEQPQRWLSKLGLAQQEASSLELEPEPGLACPGTPVPTHSPITCLPPAFRSGQRGLPQPFLALCFLPPASVWVGLGGGGSGWAQAPPSPERLLKLLEREGERGGGMFAPSQGRHSRGKHCWPGCLLYPPGSLLPAVHFCLFVLVGRIPLVTRGGEVGTLPTSPQTGLPSSRPHLVAEQPEEPAASRALPTA